MPTDTEQLIQSLGLTPHPEGGHYRRTHASVVQVTLDGALRPAMTAIQFLLRQGECSRWHRVDADEVWHWQRGGALCLQTFDPQSGQLSSVHLDGGDLAPMAVVPAGHWQRAWTQAHYALVACTVSPGFVWEGFALLDTAPEVAERLHALNAADAS